MRIGKLRQRIAIQMSTSSPDVAGGFTNVWINFAILWASIEPVSGKELYEAQQVQNEVSHKIRIRYFSGLTTSMRISFESRIFEIKSIINWEERDRELLLMCSEVKS